MADDDDACLSVHERINKLKRYSEHVGTSASVSTNVNKTNVTPSRKSTGYTPDVKVQPNFQSDTHHNSVTENNTTSTSGDYDNPFADAAKHYSVHNTNTNTNTYTNHGESSRTNNNTMSRDSSSESSSQTGFVSNTVADENTEHALPPRYEDLNNGYHPDTSIEQPDKETRDNNQSYDNGQSSGSRSTARYDQQYDNGGSSSNNNTRMEVTDRKEKVVFDNQQQDVVDEKFNRYETGEGLGNGGERNGDTTGTNDAIDQVDVVINETVDTINHNKKKNSYFQDVVKIPFSIWSFMFIFLIFRLFVISNSVVYSHDHYKQVVVDSCEVTQMSLNILVDAGKVSTISTLNTFVTTTAEQMAISMSAINTSVSMTSSLDTFVIEAVIDTLLTIPIIATTTVDNNFINSLENAENSMQSSISNTLLSLNAWSGNVYNTIYEIMVQSWTVLLDSMTDVADSPNSKSNSQYIWTNYYLPGLIKLNGDQLAYFKIPTSLTLQVSNGWNQPNFGNIGYKFYKDTNFQQLLNTAVSNITVFNTTLFNSLASINMDNYVLADEFKFCTKLNLITFDDVTNTLLTSIDGMIIGLFIVMVSIMLVELLIITYQHKKGSLRPASCPKGCKLDICLSNMCHKTSMICILVGILGIIMFSVLKSNIDNANQSFEEYVIPSIRDFESNNIVTLQSDMNVISSNFATVVNGQLGNLRNTINTVEMNVNNTLWQLNGIQATIENYLYPIVSNTNNPAVASPLMTMISNMTALTQLPISQILAALPSVNNIINVGSNVLVINVTQAQVALGSTLSYASTSPYSQYSAVIETDLYFYYFLTGYGVPIIIIGLFVAMWQIATRDRNKRNQTIIETGIKVDMKQIKQKSKQEINRAQITRVY